LGLRFDAGALAADDPVALLAYALLAIGPIEEIAKLLPFVLVVIRFKAFDERLDGTGYRYRLCALSSVARILRLPGIAEPHSGVAHCSSLNSWDLGMAIDIDAAPAS